MVARRWFWAWVVFLALAHQDWWWWDTRSLVFGVIPIGLFYQAAFSIVAGLTWAVACRVAWPDEIEAWADEPTDPEDTSRSTTFHGPRP